MKLLLRVLGKWESHYDTENYSYGSAPRRRPLNSVRIHGQVGRIGGLRLRRNCAMGKGRYQKSYRGEAFIDAVKGIGTSRPGAFHIH